MKTLALALLLLTGPAQARTVTGVASVYADKFQDRRTYTGERFDQARLTLASRRFPMGARVRVRCLRTKRSVVAIVNDLGPNGRYRHRVADLSRATARRIGHNGLERVTITEER